MEGSDAESDDGSGLQGLAASIKRAVSRKRTSVKRKRQADMPQKKKKMCADGKEPVSASTHRQKKRMKKLHELARRAAPSTCQKKTPSRGSGTGTPKRRSTERNHEEAYSGKIQAIPIAATGSLLSTVPGRSRSEVDILDECMSMSTAEEKRMHIRQTFEENYAMETTRRATTILEPGKAEELADELMGQGGEGSRPAAVCVYPLKDLMRNVASIHTHSAHLGKVAASQTPEKVEEEKHVWATIKKEPVRQALRDLVANLPTPEFSAEGKLLKLERATTLMRTRAFTLPIIPAALDSALLVQSGTFTVSGFKRDFQPCSSGNSCVTKKYAGSIRGMPEGGFVLTGFMLMNEMQEFIRTGRSPRTRRPCVLCMRMYTTQIILDMRSSGDTGSGVMSSSALRALGGTSSSSSSSSSPVQEAGPSDSMVPIQFSRCLVDTEGGYRSQHVLTPQMISWEGLLDPVPALDLFMLSAKQAHPSGQWRIDQSAITVPKRKATVDPETAGTNLHAETIDAEATVPPAAVGERSWDFRERVARNVVGGTFGSVAERAVCSTQLARATGLAGELLARSNVAPSGSRAAQQPPREEWVPYCADVIVSLGEINHIFPNLDTCRYFSVVHHVSPFPHIMKCCFWGDTKNDEALMDKVLSKVTPQPCQTRHFDRLIRKIMCQRDRLAPNDKAAVYELLGWISCSLLGTLPSCSADERFGFADCGEIASVLARDKQLLDRLCLALVRQSHLFAFCLREYMAWSVERYPPLQENLSKYFDWEGFRRITRTCMRRFRLSVKEKVLSSKEGAGVAAAWVARIEALAFSMEKGQMFKAEHKAVRKSGYQRSRAKLLDTLHTYAHKKSHKFQIVVNDDPDDPRSISKEKLELLDRWVRKLDPAVSTLEADVMPHLGQLAHPREFVEQILDVCMRYDYQRLGKRMLRRLVDEFRQSCPYTFYTVQCLCSLWYDARLVNMFPLPAHYFDYQLEAVRGRFNIPDTEAAPLECLVLRVCRVCHTVYSHTRVWRRSGVSLRSRQSTASKEAERDREGRIRSAPEHASTTLFTEPASAKVVRLASGGKLPAHLQDKYGLDRASVDLTNGKVYCRNNKVIGGACCAETELDAYPLLGRVVVINSKRVYAICPQKNCGMVSLIDFAQARFNERGFCCSKCTAKTQIEALKQAERQLRPYRSLVPKCCLCRNKCVLSKTYLYGPVSLCSQHNGPHMVHATRSIQKTHLRSGTRERAEKASDRAAEARSAKFWVARLGGAHKKLADQRRRRLASRNKWAVDRGRRNTRSRRSLSVHFS